MKKALQYFILTGFFFMIHGISYAEPVLNFSDITSGPKTGLNDGLGSGAIVTIWGDNLGSSQGTSKVYVGNVEAAYVYYWGNANGSKAAGPADLYTYHKMQTVAFSVPAAAVDGANTIKVTVNGITSNTLPFTIRTGNIYHVKTTGSNSNNGSWSAPWRNLDGYGTNGALSGNKMSAGDILYAHDGLSEAWVARGLVGTVDKPIAIIAYPNASVVAIGGIDFYADSCAYVHASKFICQSDATGAGTNNHGRLVGNAITDITCANGQSGAVSGGNLNFAGSTRKVVDGNIALGNYIHDFGGACTAGLHHVFYISNRSGSPVEAFEIGWNYLVGNQARGALHVYDEGACGDYTGTIKVHDNVVKDQAGPGVGISAGLGGTNCITAPINVWNNVLINTGTDPNNQGWNLSAIDVNKSGLSSLIKFYNNTIYGWGAAGRGNSAPMMYIQGAGNSDWVFGGQFEWVNNVVVDTNNLPYEPTTYAKTPVVHSNNLWYSTSSPKTAPAWDSNPIAKDPLFVNAVAGNFQLQPTSPAIKTGTSTVNTVVRRDLYGGLRTNPPDLGAIGYGTVIAPKPPVLRPPQ